MELPPHRAECFFIVVQRRKAAPQEGHEWGVLPVWIVRCSLRREDEENLDGQSSHLAAVSKGGIYTKQ